MNRHVLAALLSSPDREGATSFSRLSEDAQGYIVDSVLGKYDQSGPPEIPESVRAEIIAWSQTDETK